MKHYQKLMTSGQLDAHAEHWKAVVAQLTSDFHFRQTWRSRPLGDASGQAAQPRCQVEIDVAAEVSRRVLELGKNKDIGAFVIALAGWLHTLEQIAPTGPVWVATPLLEAGATTTVYRDTVPLTASLAPTRTFRELIGQVRQVVADAATYQEFPVSEVFEVLGMPMATSNVLIECPAIHRPVTDRQSFDLIIRVQTSGHGPGGVRFVLQGNPAYFDDEFLRCLGRSAEGVLARLDQLDRPLATISPVRAQDESRLRAAYTGRSRAYPTDRTIHRLFEDRVSENPDKIAIRAGAREFTYRDVDRQANRLAHFLRDNYRVSPGDPVAVLASRSELGIIALLAILKAGGVYLPIDPKNSHERIGFMVRDAGARALLIYSEHLSLLTGLSDVPTFALDLQMRTLKTPEHASESNTCSNSPAYIIYTSGSTGSPKGVILAHDGFINMIYDHIDYFGIEASDRVSRFYSPAFDSSLFEIFAALLSGATSVVIAQEIIDDPNLFSELIERERVTVSVFPPVYLSNLEPARLKTLRVILNAGDVARPTDAQLHARTRAYYNSYGPTETSVCATYYRVDPTCQYGSRIPIGRAIGNTAVYLMNDSLELVPEGMIGELCIAGPGLAQGYLGRPALTAERFVPNPFGDGQRLYRTGDMGVLLPGGEIELIGRIDHQVKIRGYRIELGEIETILTRHDGVAEAIVVAPENAAGDRRLVAYYTPALADARPAADDLRAFLRSKLPEYMVPALFVQMEEWPLTANGKIDRKKLPAPDAAASDDSRLYDPPVTPVQQTLVEIWQEVLGIARVGIQDNFFEIGGDSILIIQMVSRANQRGLHLKPKDLFEHQVIADLARVAVEGASVVAEQGEVTGEVALTPIQRWFFAQALAQPHHFNQSVLLAVPATLNAEHLEAALAAVLEHHDALRARFRVTDGGWSQEIAPAGQPAPFDIVDLEAVPTAEREAALVASATELQSSLDIHEGPLVKARFFRFDGEDSARLLFVVHHLVIDGVSWRILLEDFYAAYQALDAGLAPALPAKTTSYRSWAQKLSELDLREQEEEAAYWREVASKSAGIPLDFVDGREANTVGSEETVVTVLSASETRSLLQEAPRAYNTQINDILLTALLSAFAPWTGSDDLVLDLEGHGREELFSSVDLSRTVGWFTSLFPVALRRASDQPGEALRSVKEQLRRIPRRGVGYGLMRYLGDDASMAATSDVIFNYLGQTDRVLSPDARWQPITKGAGPEQGPDNARPYLLAIDALVSQGRLEVSWVYCRHVHQRATIEDLADRFRESLLRLVEHCKNPTAGGYTPSDFPAAKLSQSALDKLVAKLNA